MGPAEQKLASIIGGYVMQIASLMAERDALEAQVKALTPKPKKAKASA